MEQAHAMKDMSEASHTSVAAALADTESIKTACLLLCQLALLEEG
jgi:hypothetical protein